MEFRARFKRPAPGQIRLRLAASTLYRVRVNGHFAGHGPARAGHGFYRIDEWDLSRWLQEGDNDVTIEVAGYNANSYYLLDQPSFLQAELVANRTVLAATGCKGFQAVLRRDRVQKVQRYSFQRPFSEIWRLPAPREPVSCAVVGAKPLAPRRVPYPTFALRPRVLGLLTFLAPLENEDGLLEKLPGWVFVEWSKANEFVQDVNYPSNMLYAETLDAAGRLYAIPELARKASRTRKEILGQSFDGEFFVDNAVRTADGKLGVTRNRTEVCQYFAFYFGIATPATHGDLWKKLVTEFGPQRKQTRAHPQIHPANAFIGNMLRFELLSRAGRVSQVLDETIGYWLFMADRTGTLWENDTPHASCNHGFASHAAHVFLRDVLGLYHVDPRTRTIQLRLADLPLDWCEGELPTPDGPIQMRWWKDGDQLAYRLHTPPGFRIEVENLGSRPIIRH